MLLYADDISLVITESSSTALKQQATSLLNDINSWFKSNLLLLNLNKTQYLEFSTKNSATNELIHDRNNLLHTVTYIKFLGLTIDYILSWHRHIESLVKRLASISYALRSLKYLLQKETLKMMYYGEAQPVMSYGIIFWGQSTEASRVFVMQKKLLRIIFNLNPTDLCRNIFKQNQIMTLYLYYM